MRMLARLTAILPRPLDPVRSIKMKLGLLVVACGLVATFASLVRIADQKPEQDQPTLAGREAGRLA